MTNNFEKSVKGATKIKLAPPKSKYIEHILLATRSGEAGVGEIFRTLQFRLRDSTWTIVFKGLIVLHLMMREGAENATLEYLAENPRKVAISSFSEVQAQGHNIRRYFDYLITRAKAYADTKVDHVRSGQGRLKRLTVSKGLLRETEVVQRQIKALLKCDLLTDEVENEITLTAFRLLTMDLLALYSVMNEGTINVLEHYFEMSRPDSERALEIYKTFSAQTEEVVKFLGVARHFEYATRLEIPNLKHASTDLTQLLEDDLKDPDFEQRRREYQLQRGAKTAGRAGPGSAGGRSPILTKKEPISSSSNRPQTAPAPKTETKAPAPDLIDFFESIEPKQQQTTIPPAPQQPQLNFQQAGFGQQMFQAQPTGFPNQQGVFTQPAQPGFIQQQTGFAGDFNQPNTNPFNHMQAQSIQPQPQLQPQPTGAGFGGYGPQSYTFQNTLSAIPQEGVATFPQQQVANGLQPQTTNPFRASMLVTNQTAFNQPGQITQPLTRQNTNPFAKRLSAIPPSNPPPMPSFQQTQSPVQSLQAQRTGTNPFAKQSPSPQPSLQQQTLQPLHPNPTGSTNPFRQSAFINQQTGQGWQVAGQQGTMGGLEQLGTVPVFPRPGMA
ncbi:ENTH domain protein [Talaromyces stipitatus ATCC 10500]|uniref:ENTH domain protein n=1 Tax=Talaromyces stipitatus (strain ATCC 10500 / CBS 375.48 / QM 6759 / NRRL 1006) TaxID=441959 RepID=B8MGZ0_TALSN|nr:ENTH domain protein [Talaromyces stipitatus ATCC 10500]EED16371.1 ENTH domain protein [Talaromyces stipitatus ATCC 10500]